MAVLKILKFGEPTLRKTSRPVEEITPRIITLLDDMIETMRAAQWDSLTFSPVHSICVSRNGRYGLISYDGSEILPCAYEWISGCADPALTVVKDNKWGALSFYGDWITPCEWDSLCFQKDYKFGYTWIITRKGEQQYTLDLEGNLLK